MSWMRATYARLGELLYRRRREQELAEEIESHLQLHIDDNLRSGMDPVEARRQALIKFGGMDSTKEAYRAHRGFSFGGTVWQDLRYAARMLKKSPGFTVAVVLSLALGIGANTAIFSLIDAVMLKFLPVKNPEQLVLLKWAWPGPGTPPQVHSQNGGNDAFSYPTFIEIREHREIFSGTLAFSANNDDLTVKADGQTGLARGELVSGSYFSTLAVRPVMGRLFVDSDDRLEAPPVAVISYRFWGRRFAGSSSAVGKAITVNGVPFTIIGIAPPEFFGLSPGTVSDVWVPLNTQPKVEPLWTEDGKSKFLRRDDWWLLVMGRLQPGVTPQAAVAKLGVIFQQSISYQQDSANEIHDTTHHGAIQSAFPSLVFVPGGKGIERLRNEFSQPLLILMAVVGLVLLIACANAANLLMARATARYKEIAVRLAIGAVRKRLIRQLLTESMLLAFLGGGCGLALAYWGTRLLVSLMSGSGESLNANLRPDLHVLAFTMTVSLLTGLLFGLVPALRATRLDLTSAMKENSKSVEERQVKVGLRELLVVSQVTMSLLLLVGAGLFIRTLVNLERTNIGFDQNNLLLFKVAPTQNGYEGIKLARFYEELRERLLAIPGVNSSSFVRHALVGGGTSASGYSIQGYAPRADESHGGRLSIQDDQVGPGFFETMRIPVMLGRTIDVHDDTASPKIAVVNESFVRKYLGKSNPLGRRIGHDQKSDGAIEIVGVVSDTKYSNLRNESPAAVFLPRLQNPDAKDYAGMTFVLRSARDPRDLVPEISRAVQNLDPNLPIPNIKTQSEQIDQTLFQERLFAKLSSFFGLLALILACIGIYGIMSYAVARRTNEIGIRMALGARQEVILRNVLREALALVLVGIAIGIPISFGVLRFIASMLFGLKPTDPLTLAITIAFMLAVAAIAGYLPARRASRVDPMVALRYE